MSSGLLSTALAALTLVAGLVPPIAAAAQDEIVVVADRANPTAVVIDTNSDSTLSSTPFTSVTCAMNSDGDTVWGADEVDLADPSFVRWSLSGGSLSQTAEIPRTPGGEGQNLILSDDDDTLMYGIFEPHGVVSADTRRLTEVGLFSGSIDNYIVGATCGNVAVFSNGLGDIAPGAGALELFRLQGNGKLRALSSVPAPEEVIFAKFHPSCQYLTTASLDDGIRTYRVQGPHLRLQETVTPVSAPREIAFDDEGTVMYLQGRNDAIRAFEFDRGQLGSELWSIAWAGLQSNFLGYQTIWYDAGGKKLYALEERAVAVLDAVSGVRLSTIEHPAFDAGPLPLTITEICAPRPRR